MVVKKKGGKKGKKGKKPGTSLQRNLEFKGENQEYAQVTKLLGDCRLLVDCFDGKSRLCHIRGNMRKKIFINMGDIIIISLRDFEKETDGSISKCDAIYLYNREEVKKLIKLGEIPENTAVNNEDADQNIEDIGIEFESEEEKMDIDLI